MAADSAQLEALLGPVVEALGYELLGIEYLPRRSGAMVRLYIDHADGITADDCGKVSHQVSGVLDVEDPIAGRYVLEVSSPGLDRPLFKEEHFRRFTGHEVRIRLHGLVQGRRKLTGILRGASEGTITVEDGGEVYRVPLGAVSSARLVPDL